MGKKILFTYCMLLCALALTSCVEYSKREKCSYTIHSLFASHDSSLFEVNIYEGVTEVIDQHNDANERGIYKFDENGVLRFYAYLIDSLNNFFFSINYDSSGRQMGQLSSPVVRWFVSKADTESVSVMFLLYQVNHSYGEVRVIGNNVKQVSLYKADKSSNLIGATITIQKPMSDTMILRAIEK
jgi:hypothetical protein